MLSIVKKKVFLFSKKKLRTSKSKKSLDIFTKYLTIMIAEKNYNINNRDADDT